MYCGEQSTVISDEYGNYTYTTTTSPIGMSDFNNIAEGDLLIHGSPALTKDDVSDILNELITKLSKAPILKHQCHGCGGTVELDADDHLFRCPYCGSVYAIGTAMING